VAFGVDIGGTKVLGVALDHTNEVVAEARVPTPKGSTLAGPDGAHPVGPGQGAGEVAHAIAEVVAQLDAGTGSGRPAGDLPAIGVGAPGMLDRQGRLRFSPNLPQAHGVDWSALLGERLAGRRIFIENDANLAVLAEHRLGAGQGHRHVVMVTLGTGIGGGLMIGGRVQVGSAGFAGEIGHMVVDPNGPPCPCGRRGCWERFASGAGLGVLAREAALAGRLGEVVRLAGGDPESVRGEDVSAAAAAGDPAAQQVIREVGWWIGFGLANLAAVLDPGCFVLGGGVIQAGDLLIQSARATFAELVEGGQRRPGILIAAAAFGERAGAVGGALAVREGGLG
jgi:glucokinase